MLSGAGVYVVVVYFIIIRFLLYVSLIYLWISLSVTVFLPAFTVIKTKHMICDEPPGSLEEKAMTSEKMFHVIFNGRSLL